MARNLENDVAALARAAKKQLELADMLTASLQQRMRAGARLAKTVEAPWQPDDSWRGDMKLANDTLVQVGGALQKALEAEAKRLHGFSIEDLEQQLRHEMIRAAATFSQEDWTLLDRVRMQQVLKG
jgi:hypothetical protein